MTGPSSLPAQQAGAGHGLVGEAAVCIERLYADGGRTIDIVGNGLPGRITSRNSRDIGRFDHIRHARELAHVGPATTVCSGKHYTANGVEHDGTLERMDR